MDGRSQRGCWTCRARRKKCDEGRQNCATCLALGLPCHGYGPRPSWMDGGQRERARVVEFKEIVKRRPRQKRQSVSSADNNRSMVYDQPHSNSSTTEYTFDTQRAGSSISGDIPANIFTPDTTITSPLSALSSVNSNTFSSASYPDVFEGSHVPFPGSMTPLEMFNFSHSPSQVSNILDDVMSQQGLDTTLPFSPTSMTDRRFPVPPPAAQSREGGDDFWLHSSQTDRDISMSGPEAMSSSLIHQASISLILASRPLSGHLNTLKFWELDALRYYLESVFPLLFPFLEPSLAKVICYELVQLASTSRCCLASMLAQSLSVQQTQLQNLGVPQQPHILQSAASRGKVAVEELRLLLQHLDIASETGNAPEASSQAEAQVCLVLIMLSKEARLDMPWPDICKLQDHLDPIALDSLGGSWQLLACYFQSVLLCLSLLSCISTAAEPTFARKFRDQLEDEKSIMFVDKVLGCDKKVLYHILDIAELQQWKESGATEGTVSVVELVKRAIPIEKGLQKLHLQYSENDETILDQSSSLTRQQAAVTKAVACAASVYLYGTLCGLRPEVPELKNAIAETIVAIKHVPNATTMKGLTWSVAVAAIAAEGEDRIFFQEFAQGILEQFGKCEVYQALLAAFEFWKRRDAASREKKEYSWKEALSQEGNAVLLFL